MSTLNRFVTGPSLELVRRQQHPGTRPDRAAIWVRDLMKAFPVPRDFRALFSLASRPTKVDALRGVTLEVFAGEVLGLVGPNGAGKTTLLEILSTLLLPDSGQARVCGYDVISEAAKVRETISYCSSASQTFYPRLTGWQNLEFFAALNDLSPADAREKIRDGMSLMGLDRAAHTTFQCYSDGMKQRLALARALLTGAPVLLLDEPTKGLDPAMQAEMQQLMRRTLVDRLGKTLLLVTHSLTEAEALCDRVALLREGVIVCVGDPSEILPRTLGTVSESERSHRSVNRSSTSKF